MCMFKGISVGSEGLQITHLQFANDTLIFCEAKVHYLLRIENILLSFQSFSGLMVNFNKSGLLVMGMDEVWGQQVVRMHTYTVTNDVFRNSTWGKYEEECIMAVHN